jgi:hypothetical protein
MARESTKVVAGRRQRGDGYAGGADARLGADALDA